MFDKQTGYKRSVIKFLYFTKELSCADLSKLTKKSLPLVTKVLNELIAEGAVVENGYAHSTGGRRPQMYSLKKDLMFVVSVAMDQLVTRIALLDMHNTLVGEVEQIDLPLTDNPNALPQLADYIDSFITQTGVDKDSVVGIGIGMPGFVDVEKGVNHSFLKTSQGSIVSHIEAVVGLPVLIDNDSSLVALAEQKFGVAVKKKNVMVLSLGWGIGLGMILNGELFRGDNGFAGEFSHIPLFTNNKICSCGKSGCLETEASLLVVVEKATQGIKEGKVTILQNLPTDSVEEASNIIMEAAQRGDRFAIELFYEIAYNIGRGIAILIHLLNPKLIVLSGRGSQAGRLWLAPIQQAINEHCIPNISENVEVKVSSLGHQAEVIGAAALVMENYDKSRSKGGKKSAVLLAH
ncbi:transcriptional regulator [Rufibacter glacialis]|uniref:ROK family protein n=1 Tax=Rufibacter glacialis TaxID=1259555 RepID=A0A5M8Q912_9BACT|nr:ROK family protein [Rufibacter glacialis]GGK78712.1 transcriptional regulator [Rufibacter glacialis]